MDGLGFAAAIGAAVAAFVTIAAVFWVTGLNTQFGQGGDKGGCRVRSTGCGYGNICDFVSEIVVFVKYIIPQRNAAPVGFAHVRELRLWRSRRRKRAIPTARTIMHQPSPETVALARQMYIDGASVSEILAATQLSLGALYYWLDGGPDDPALRLTPIPRRRDIKGQRRRLTEAARASLVTRLWQSAERQVRDIEGRLKQAAIEPAERERDARLLAVLVKTLRELNAIDDSKRGKGAADHQDDEPPRDLDEFRRELARRMDAFVDSRTGTGVSGDPAAK